VLCSKEEERGVMVFAPASLTTDPGSISIRGSLESAGEYYCPEQKNLSAKEKHRADEIKRSNLARKIITMTKIALQLKKYKYARFKYIGQGYLHFTISIRVKKNIICEYITNFWKHFLHTLEINIPNTVLQYKYIYNTHGKG
jgi:hypothetical protein